MARVKFDLFRDTLPRLAFRLDFLKNNPQCSKCEHVEEDLIFNRHVYEKLVRPKYCPECPNFDDTIPYLTLEESEALFESARTKGRAEDSLDK